MELRFDNYKRSLEIHNESCIFIGDGTGKGDAIFREWSTTTETEALSVSPRLTPEIEQELMKIQKEAEKLYKRAEKLLIA